MKTKWITAVAVMIAMCIALPVMTSEKVDNAKVKEIIGKELEAMKAREAQTKCPISGADVAEGKGHVYMGYMIGTCCDNCAAKVEKDPLTALLKMRQAGQEPMLAEGYTKNTKCPLSGKDVAEGAWAVKDNVLVKFCCNNCVAAYKEDPAKVTAKMNEAKTAPAAIITMAQTVCPLSGHAADGSTSLVYKGKEVNLCCAACKAGFEADPDKHLQTMADMGFVVAAAK